MWSWLRKLRHLAFPGGRIPESRELFLSGRVPLADEQFLAQLECSDQDLALLVVFIRKMFGAFCSIDPEMIYPSDRTDHLEQIIDWGRELFGWWGDGDCGRWHPHPLCREFAREFARGGADWHTIRLHRPLPPFGQSPRYGWKHELPETFGEWVMVAARIILEALPNGWQTFLPEYPEGIEERFGRRTSNSS